MYQHISKWIVLIISFFDCTGDVVAETNARRLSIKVSLIAAVRAHAAILYRSLGVTRRHDAPCRLGYWLMGPLKLNAAKQSCNLFSVISISVYSLNTFFFSSFLLISFRFCKQLACIRLYILRLVYFLKELFIICFEEIGKLELWVTF